MELKSVMLDEEKKENPWYLSSDWKQAVVWVSNDDDKG